MAFHSGKQKPFCQVQRVVRLLSPDRDDEVVGPRAFAVFRQQAGSLEQGLVGRRADHQRGHDAVLLQRLRDAHECDGVGIEAASHKVFCPVHFKESTKASSARSKQARGARATPAPTCPTPGLRCAMPVLIAGWMPVAATLRASMPAGTPCPSSAGMVHFGFLPTVSSPMSRVKASASLARPAPTNPITARASAMAKAPRPMVSMIAESPMSGFASRSLKPGKNNPFGSSTGAVNQASPVAEKQDTKAVPLRHIADARLQASIERTGSMTALPIAM